ncbi:hypothetical protein C2G38_2164409 [Gigaspora rosea]|uniref:Uncharacterized protein n=1 Tax=Gigaspora rosea TaxID=44941 RepID=A0A397VU05_9GLOM|nr:hypothetical protein C2G38_2164409 [Gigaspora rosea]
MGHNFARKAPIRDGNQGLQLIKTYTNTFLILYSVVLQNIYIIRRNGIIVDLGWGGILNANQVGTKLKNPRVYILLGYNSDIIVHRNGIIADLGWSGILNTTQVDPENTRQ